MNINEEDEKWIEMFNSEQFKEIFKNQVEKNTWDVGLPKAYMDNDGYLVHHYKDGSIKRIKKIKK